MKHVVALRIYSERCRFFPIPRGSRYKFLVMVLSCCDSKFVCGPLSSPLLH